MVAMAVEWNEYFFDDKNENAESLAEKIHDLEYKYFHQVIEDVLG